MLEAKSHVWNCKYHFEAQRLRIFEYASNTDVVNKTILQHVCIMSLSPCLYVCFFAIIKTRSSNFPELLMMMPVAPSSASQVEQ